MSDVPRSPDLLADWDARNEGDSSSDESESYDSENFAVEPTPPEVLEEDGEDVFGESHPQATEPTSRLTFQYDLESSQDSASQSSPRHIEEGNGTFQELSDQILTKESGVTRKAEGGNRDVQLAQGETGRVLQEGAIGATTQKYNECKLGNRLQTGISHLISKGLPPEGKENLLPCIGNSTTPTENNTEIVNAMKTAVSGTKALPIKIAKSSQFSACEGNPIQFPNNAILKAENKVKEYNRKEIEEPATKMTKCSVSTAPMSLFSTGKGQAIHISENAIAKARNKIQEYNRDELEENTTTKPKEPTPSTSDTLFSTGKGRGIQISENAIAKAQIKLQEYCQEDSEQSEGGTSTLLKMNVDSSSSVSLFSSGKGDDIKISKKAIEKAKRVVNINPEDSLKISENKNTPNHTNQNKDPANTSPGGQKRPRVTTRQPLLPRKRSAVTPGKVNVQSRSETQQDGQRLLLTPSISKSMHKPRHDGGPGLNSTPLHYTHTTPKNLQLKRPLRRATHGNTTAVAVPSVPRRGASSTPRAPSRRGFVTPFKKQRSKPEQADEPLLVQTPLRKVMKRKHTQSTENLCRLSLVQVLDEETKRRSTIKSISQKALAAGLPSWLVFTLTCSNSSFVVFHKESGKAMGLFPDGHPKDFVGWREIREILLSTEGISAESASFAWVANHFRWIVWKLGSLQRRFPENRVFANCLTLDHVLAQLEHRYEREFELVHRPILRKVLEKDAPSSTHMVLMFAQISTTQILVTDGWYAIQAAADPSLQELLDNGRLGVGSKFRVCSAVMRNNESGVSPLECACNYLLPSEMDATSQAQPILLLSRNSMAPVSWDTKLGQQRSAYFTKRLSSIKRSPDTIVPCIEGIVSRRFVLKFAEKNSEDGRWIMRDSAAEAKAQQSHDELSAFAKEAVINDLQKKWDKSNLDSMALEDLDHSSPLLDDEYTKIFERKQASLESERRLELEAALRSDSRIPPARSVKKVLQLLLQQPFRADVALITVWGPAQALVDCKEGSTLRVHGAVVKSHGPMASRNVLSLSASKFEFVDTKFPLDAFDERKVCPIEDVEAMNPLLVDTVGCIVGSTKSHVFVSPLVDSKGKESSTVLALEWEHPRSISDSIGTIVALRDAIYRSKDPYTGFLTCDATQQASSTSNPRDLGDSQWHFLQDLYKKKSELLSSDQADAHLTRVKLYVKHQLGVRPSPVQPQMSNHVTAPTPITTGSKKVERTPLQQRQVNIDPEAARQERLRLQKLKQRQWRENHALSAKVRHGSLRTSAWTQENPFTLTIQNKDLSLIMLGRKTIELRKRTQGSVANLKFKDVVKFTDGFLVQLVSVKAVIPYTSCSNALEHEDISMLTPTERSPDRSLQVLTEFIPPNEPVLAIHFSPIDC